jgi:hypothetical protein
MDKIPDELLEKIILFVQAITEDWDAEYWHWIVLLNVSRGWRMLIINAPELWRKIDLDWGDADLYFKLSKATPLNLSSLESQDFPAKFIEHSARVRECSSIMTPLTAQAFYAHLKTGPVPILEKLRLESCGDKLQQPIFDAVIPSLRRLRLKNIPIDWSSPGLSGLTHLDFTHYKEQSMFDVLGMLEGTRDLRHLVLRGTVPDCDASCDPKSRISLPHLNMLKLKGAWSRSIHFTNHLTFPTSAWVEIVASDSPEQAEFAKGVQLISLAPGTQYGMTFNWLGYNMVVEAKSISGGTQNLRRFRCESNQTQPRITPFIGPIFGKYKNVVSLDIAVGWNWIDQTMWLEALDEMEQVSKLQVGHSSESGPFRELLLALAQGPQNVLLPNLRTLILDGICSLLRGARKPSRRTPRSVSAILMPALLMRKSMGIGLRDLRVAACKQGESGDIRAIKNLVGELRCKRVTCEACVDEEDEFDDDDDDDDDESDSDSDYFEFK